MSVAGVPNMGPKVRGSRSAPTAGVGCTGTYVDAFWTVPAGRTGATAAE